VPLVEKIKITDDDTTYITGQEYVEGKELLRLHSVRERDPQPIKGAKKRFMKVHGELFCEACGNNFQKKYM
jgi:predicted HNH restriction endonuclease